jgi:transposase
VAGAKLLLLPPYSPDLNSIGRVVAKPKLLFRGAAERSVEATWKRIGSLLNVFPPQECANFSETPAMLLSKQDKL